MLYRPLKPRLFVDSALAAHLLGNGQARLQGPLE